MFVNELFNKKKITESLRDGEYYTYTVTFADGTTDTINVASDEFDFGSYYAKKGKKVTDVARQGGIQGSRSDTPSKPHDFPDDRGLTRAQRSYDRQVPEGFTDDTDNIYAVHPDSDLSESLVFLIMDVDESEFDDRWAALPMDYLNEFGGDLPLWDTEDLRMYPNIKVKTITFDQYVKLVGNYIRSDDMANTALTKMQKGVAEGISVVDQDYDLDQIILTLDIEGKRVYFTYTDYEEDFSNAERRDVFDQLQEQPWYKGLDHPTKMEILDAAYRAIRGLEPQEYRPTVGDEPLDEQGVAEAEKKPHPKTWHDVDPKLGKAVNKMSQAEKVKKGYAHPDTLKKKGVAEGLPPMGFVRSTQRHDPIKNPLRTFVEISNLLGITHNQLNALTKKYPGFPSPHPGIGKQVGRGKNNYYDLQQAKQWIKNNDIQNRIKSWSSNKEQGLEEGSVQDKLYKRHQELRKKRGAPDPNYYKELKTTFDLPDDERWTRTAELKKKYKVTNEDITQYLEEMQRAGYEIITETATLCPECGGAAYADRMLAEKQDACYHKVKSRYKVWPSAYASGALVRCRKKGAKNWGNKSKK